MILCNTLCRIRACRMPIMLAERPVAAKPRRDEGRKTPRVGRACRTCSGHVPATIIRPATHPTKAKARLPLIVISSPGR
jgi:hypothetical protein